MSKTAKIIWGVVIVVVIIVVVAYAINDNNGSKSNAIKMGFIGPLTGDAATYGQAAQNSIELAVKDLAAQGKNIQVTYEDGKCDGADATSAANKLIAIDQVKIILGGTCSGEALAALPITEANKVIQFSSFASSPALTGAGKFFFRNNPSDAAGGKVIADVVLKSYKNVAIISEQTDYAKALHDVFVNEITQGGGKMVSDQTFVSNTTDFRSILSTIKASNPQVLFVDAQTEQEEGLIVKQARELGITAPFYGHLIPGSSDFVKVAGSAADGMIFTQLASLNASDTKVTAFLDEYKQAYGTSPDWEYYAAASYDAVNILAQAVDAVGMDTTKIADYLHAMPAYHGIIGTYSFDANGDMIGAQFAVYTIKNGQVVPFGQ